MIAAYLNVPVYAAFHDWLGRGEQLADMWRLWKEGDRKAAAEFSFFLAIPTLFAACAYEAVKNRHLLAAADLPAFGVGFAAGKTIDPDRHQS